MNTLYVPSNLIQSFASYVFLVAAEYHAGKDPHWDILQGL